MNPKRLFLILLVLLFALVTTVVVFGQGATGSRPEGAESPAEVEGIAPVVTEFGLVSISVDGVGITTTMGTVDVEKPAGATVRSAYLSAASTGFSAIMIPDGDILLEGVGVTWSTVLSNSISSYNHWADVTSIVKPIVDAAPAGTTSLDITETNSDEVDGSILAVIFDDPNQTTNNTIVLLFGAQDIAGDTFAVGLAEPINTGDPDLLLDMGLGISFGCQGSDACGDPNAQVSQVDVNTMRMSSSAGGQDDGEVANGALLTVGGLGDSNANPPDPFSDPQGDTRYDDELYNLIPFVNNGDTSIDVFTVNPSADDNIFFAYMVLNASTAVVGEGILLGPVQAANCPPSDHTLTALVQDSDGMPMQGVDVTFNVTSGPNMGVNGMDTTDANGEATFTYNGTTPGIDTIIAFFVNDQQQTIFSNEATKIWHCPTSVSLSALDGQSSGLPGGLFMLAIAVILVPLVALVIRRLRIQEG
jgi:hypothetical protein